MRKLLDAVLRRRVPPHAAAPVRQVTRDLDLVACEPVVNGRRVYLFLDFEGVMDDQYGQHPFFHAGQVEQLLRRFPSVRVVLTTSGRNFGSLEDLVRPFASDVRSLFVGVTPNARHLATAGELGERQLECEGWLYLNDAEDAPWVAVDDTEVYFKPGCEHLELVGHPGLDKACAERLAARLQALVTR